MKYNVSTNSLRYWILGLILLLTESCTISKGKVYRIVDDESVFTLDTKNLLEISTSPGYVRTKGGVWFSKSSYDIPSCLDLQYLQAYEEPYDKIVLKSITFFNEEFEKQVLFNKECFYNSNRRRFEILEDYVLPYDHSEYFCEIVLELHKKSGEIEVEKNNVTLRIIKERDVEFWEPNG